MRKFFKWWAVGAMAVGCGTSCAKKPLVPVQLGYEIVSVIPHDEHAYTQGLQWVEGRLWESAGQYKESSVREVDPKTGAVLRKRGFPADVFAEGCTLHGKELWIITWQEKTAYVLDAENFRTLRTFNYDGEGWGLTSDGNELIMSDGSDQIKFRSFKDMAVSKSIGVTDEGHALKFINELEYVKGDLYSNVYTTERIARINPKTGEVTGWLDLSALRKQLPGSAKELNGIAYDEKTGNFLITGKYWPKMFEIRLKN